MARRKTGRVRRVTVRFETNPCHSRRFSPDHWINRFNAAHQGRMLIGYSPSLDSWYLQDWGGPDDHARLLQTFPGEYEKEKREAAGRWAQGQLGGVENPLPWPSLSRARSEANPTVWAVIVKGPMPDEDSVAGTFTNYDDALRLKRQLIADLDDPRAVYIERVAENPFGLARARSDALFGMLGGHGDIRPSSTPADRPPTSARSTLYKGVRLTPVAGGWMASIDPDTVFDDLRQAKRFVNAWMKRRNPRKGGRSSNAA